MWTGARTERTIRAVHEQNLKYAQEAGMSLDEWHKAMSEKGKQPPKIVYISEKTDEEIAIESARWIGGYHRNLLSGFGFKKKK